MRVVPFAFVAAACASAPAAAPPSVDATAMAAWQRRQPDPGGGLGDGVGVGNGLGNGDGFGNGEGAGLGNGNGFGLGSGDAPRRGAGRRIDVAFRAAPLDEALRLLAEAARVGLVLTDVPSVRVTLRLRDVDPRDALVALANAHGLGVDESPRVWVLTPVRAEAGATILPP